MGEDAEEDLQLFLLFGRAWDSGLNFNGDGVAIGEVEFFGELDGVAVFDALDLHRRGVRRIVLVWHMSYLGGV